MKRTLGLVAVLTMIALPARAGDRALEQRLAEAYAPILYQDVDDSKHDGAPDLPTRFDFDGDKVGDNNWHNLDEVAEGKRSGDRRAYLYYDVIETETHSFISYSVFHPQDWDDSSWKGFRELVHRWSEHENDLEPILVVVEKSKTDPLGRMVLLETEAHNTVHTYGDARDVRSGTKDLEGPIKTSGRHPKVFVQSKGHGIYGADATLDTGKFPGGDGFVLSFGTPTDAYDPANGKKRDGTSEQQAVTYGLLSTHDELWPLAQGPSFGDGQASDKPDTYRGGRFSSGQTIGFSMQGAEKKPDAANWPWGQVDPSDGTKRGDWFLDPAYAVSKHFAFNAPYSTRYVSNPYFDDLGIEGGRAPKAPPQETNVAVTPTETKAIKRAVKAVCKGIAEALGE